MYALIVTALGAQDLQAAARRILGNRFRRLFGRPAMDESGLHPRDREVGRWYSWLVLAGYTFSLGMLFTVGLPAMWRSMSISFGRLGTADSWHEVFDAVVFLTLILSQFAIVGFLSIRARLRRRHAKQPQYLTT
jgi:hypothetical protein